MPPPDPATPPELPDLRPPRPPAPPAPPPLPQPRLAPWRPVSARQRLLIVALTLATVAAVTVLMLRHQARVLAAQAARHDPLRADCPRDAASAPAGCPGSAMPVMVLPAQAVQR